MTIELLLSTLSHFSLKMSPYYGQRKKTEIFPFFVQVLHATGGGGKASNKILLFSCIKSTKKIGCVIGNVHLAQCSDLLPECYETTFSSIHHPVRSRYMFSCDVLFPFARRDRGKYLFLHFTPRLVHQYMMVVQSWREQDEKYLTASTQKNVTWSSSLVRTDSAEFW